MSIPFDPPRPRPAAGGGGAAFTPVVYTGQWTSDTIISNGTKIIPDTIRINEGSDAGYGMSDSRTNAFASFLVSESMAGVYQLAVYFGSLRPTANSGADNVLPFNVALQLDGATRQDLQAYAGHTGIWSNQYTKVPETTFYTVRLPAEAQLLIGGFGGFKMSAGATMSIVKLSD